MESILNKAAELRTVKRFLYDCTAMDVEKKKSWRARTLQKCNGSTVTDVVVSDCGRGATIQNFNNGYTTPFSQQTAHSNYLGSYLSQESAFPISQSNYFQTGYHPHTIMHSNVNHGHAQHAHQLNMSYNFQPMSQRENFTQESLNANEKELGDDLDVTL